MAAARAVDQLTDEALPGLPMTDVDRVESDLLAEGWKGMQITVYACPVHGEVWRYLGPEDFDCVHCLRAAS
jgi:hypothetical protein